jgi:hypothetical protein
VAALIGVGVFILYMLFIAGFLEVAVRLGIGRDNGEALLAIVLALYAWWVMKDSERLGYRDYDSEIALSPSWMAILTMVASPLSVPWYLADRYRIKKGTLPRKPNAVPGSLGLNDRPFRR